MVVTHRKRFLDNSLMLALQITLTYYLVMLLAAVNRHNNKSYTFWPKTFF